MLDWMTLSPDLRSDHHLAGTSNPLYTAIDPDRFWWTKTGQGYPWDIQLYDDNYIYLWITELDWHDSNTFKMFRSSDPKRGNFNLNAQIHREREIKPRAAGTENGRGMGGDG